MTPPRKHAISLKDEQALIAKAQQGSKEAVTRLVALDLPFIRAYAKRVARGIIHKRNVEPDIEDLVSAGLIEFLKKIPRYDAERSNGARLRNYAFLDVKRAMVRQACDGLESVRLPRDNRIHRAHRDLENGMSQAELAEKHPNLPEEARRRLHRTTVSLEHMAQWEELGSVEDDDPEALLCRIWPRLDALDREVVTMRRLDVPPRARARRLQIPYDYLGRLENTVFERVRVLLDELSDEEPIAPEREALRATVWNMLSMMERRVVYGMAMLRDLPPYQRSKWLRMSVALVVPTERAVALRVRQLVG